MIYRQIVKLLYLSDVRNLKENSQLQEYLFARQ